MENKLKKKSINTVIYLLLAAMLVCVVMVSVFTVASRRNVKAPIDTSGTVTSPVTDKAWDSTSHDMDKAVTTAPDTEAPTTTAQNSETTPKDTAEDSSRTNVSSQTDVKASTDIRYFVIPVAGTVAKEFEIDIPVYSLTMNDYRAHTGVDIAAPIGCEVVSASSGTVCKVWNDPLMGKCITIDHGDDIYTTYMNMAEDISPDIDVGVRVSMGQSLGAVGESSLIEIAEEPHLHLEMKVDGAFVDPLEYMGVASPQESIYSE